MLNLLNITTNMDLTWGSVYFGGGTSGGRPALCIFGFPIYAYALLIVSGMALAILVAGLYFKKRGYDPYDITVYALVVIPFGVLGARMYVYIFPWDESHMMSGWSTFFDFRSGGLGIYGGVILGYLSAYLCCKIRKQDFRIVADCIMPGLFLAQSIGRWGNFANQEAYGNLITTEYNDMVNFFSLFGGGSDHGFNGIAVWIDAAHSGGKAGWYQATFFYEAFFTFLGFLICVLVLMRSKRYKLGWCSAFYGIYYGIVRLVVEGLRSDSLYLFIGAHKTDIKISQLVSVFTIVLGILLILRIYSAQLQKAYGKLFPSKRQELGISRWVVAALSAAFAAVAVVMFVLGGESRFIVGFFCSVACAYCVLGIFALQDRLKLLCSECGRQNLPAGGWQRDRDKFAAQVGVYATLCAALLALALFSLVKWGITDKLDNGYVLAVAATLCAAYFAAAKLAPAVKALKSSPDQPFDGAVTCQCGNAYCARPNAFLLFFFPAENKRDYGVENLKPWVDPEKKEKDKGKKGKLSSKDGASDIDDTASDTTDTAGTKTDNDDTANGR